jgi:hypothetical protein
MPEPGVQAKRPGGGGEHVRRELHFEAAEPRKDERLQFAAGTALYKPSFDAGLLIRGEFSAERA